MLVAFLPIVQMDKCVTDITCSKGVRKMNRTRNERGFTLIELLFSMSIIGILAGMSIVAFRIYMNNAYNAHADQMISDTQLALNAGRSSFKSVPQEFFWAWTDNAGEVQGWRVDEFLPGISVNPDTRLDANYDGWCEGSNWCAPNDICCATEWASARHCEGDNVVSYTRWRNGLVTRVEWPNWGC